MRSFRRQVRSVEGGLFLLALLACPASAYEDSDCQRSVTVTQHVEDLVTAPAEIDRVQAALLPKASSQAIRQVIGFRIQSSEESNATVVNDKADQNYSNVEKRFLDGLVRVRVIEEKKVADQGGTRVSLTADITVCVPKRDVVAKAERDELVKEQEKRRLALAKAEEDRQQKLAEQEQKDREARPAQLVDPDKAVWFDNVTGSPKLWFHRRQDQSFVFFDNSGFDPATGDKLLPVDRKVATDWKAFVARMAKEAADRAANAQREAEQKAIAERVQAEAEVKRKDLEANAVANCDSLAAAPYDPAKPASVPGVAMDALRSTVADAISACQIAVTQQPINLRFKYQLARAYQIGDPAKAAGIFQSLMARGYAAAFDNYGWSMLDRRLRGGSIEAADVAFRQGAARGDPDAMVSLANLIQEGRLAARADGEAYRLYQKAAALGHRDAPAGLERLEQQQQQVRQQQMQQEQAAQAMMSIMGGVIGSAIRH